MIHSSSGLADQHRRLLWSLEDSPLAGGWEICSHPHCDSLLSYSLSNRWQRLEHRQTCPVMAHLQHIDSYKAVSVFASCSWCGLCDFCHWDRRTWIWTRHHLPVLSCVRSCVFADSTLCFVWSLPAPGRWAQWFPRPGNSLLPLKLEVSAPPLSPMALPYG